MNEPKTNENGPVENPQTGVSVESDAVASSQPAGHQDVTVEGHLPIARSRALMSRHTAALLVIDVQEKLVPHIEKNAIVTWNIRRLIDGAGILNVMTSCTEQYPKGLGATIPLLADRLEVDDEKNAV